MNMQSKPGIEIGRRGEDEACELLIKRGHTILERNHRCGHLEIDIISLDSKGLHFVEVKTRMAPVAAKPEENVTRLKQKRIEKAAQIYLNGMKNANLEKDFEVNFDVVAVTLEGSEALAEYFPNAWIPIFT